MGEEDYPESWLFNYRWKKGKSTGSKDFKGRFIKFETCAGRTSAFVPKIQKLRSSASKKKTHATKQKRKKVMKKLNEPVKVKVRRVDRHKYVVVETPDEILSSTTAHGVGNTPDEIASPTTVHAVVGTPDEIASSTTVPMGQYNLRKRDSVCYIN